MRWTAGQPAAWRMSFSRMWSCWTSICVLTASTCWRSATFCIAAATITFIACRRAVGRTSTLCFHRLASQGIGALAQTYGPQGYNLGWNLGRVAGAGVLDHVHLHVVPRWAGDTNFMPVLADVKVLPEHLDETRTKLAEAWPG